MNLPITVALGYHSGFFFVGQLLSYTQIILLAIIFLAGKSD